MEIEIVTTKKKLSKSLINQMKFASTFDLRVRDIVLGYVRKIVKDVCKCAIIQSNLNYVLLPLDYEINDNSSVYRCRENGSKISGSRIDFRTESDLKDWWRTYKLIKRDCFRQIYI